MHLTMKKIIITLLSLMGISGCNKVTKQHSTIYKDHFGETTDGKSVERYTLSNPSGMRVQIITFGGIITTIEVPDKNGEIQDVALGFKTLKDYEKSSPYFGALIGRFGNRIANGKFNLDGKQYSLVQNNGENHLHGGTKGFDKVIWTAEPQVINDLAQLKLSYVSKDMEEGYPGNLNVEVLYTLTTENTLEVEYKASTDKKTIINLTQHTYFNLSGDIDILDHELMLNADAYLPVDKNLIPLGKLESVDDTPFNFKTSKIIGRDIENQHEQLKRGMGYDHCWVLNEANTGLRSAAVLYHPVSGRQMEVLTDQPGIQFYSGNFLDGTLSMKNSESFYGPRSGLCLETKHFPDSPNQPNFPSVVLNPREDFYSKTVFKFSNK